MAKRINKAFNRNGSSVPKFCEQCGATLSDKVNEYAALCLACAPGERKRRESSEDDERAEFRDAYLGLLESD